MDLRISEMAHFLPRHWAPSPNYETQLYVLVELDMHSVEYNKISNLFQREPASISRIQHPIAHLRYQVQSEYLTHTQQPYNSNRIYATVAAGELDKFLKFNCDMRFVTNNKHEYTSPTQAENSGNIVVVIEKRTSSIDTDKNYKPLYLVKW